MPEDPLDARGLACPMPIVKAKLTIRNIADGETLEVLADDAAFPADVRAWCAMTGHELVSLEEDGGHVTALIRKVERGSRE